MPDLEPLRTPHSEARLEHSFDRPLGLGMVRTQRGRWRAWSRRALGSVHRFSVAVGVAGFLYAHSTALAIQPLALQLDPFGESSFVLDDSGVLWAWGSNRGSQFGDGGTNASLNGIPIPLPEGVDGWMQFSGGSAFAALDTLGRIFGWGQSEADHNGFDLPIQREPILVDGGAWATIAVTTARNGTKAVPWALAATVTGELCWVRVPPPSVPSSPPFSARFTEPAPGVEGAGAFVTVKGGGNFYLAITDTGKVFAAGVGTSGCLGPAGDLKSTQFNKTFQEVVPPEPETTWTRIAATDGQAFAWSSSNDLYIWGQRFDIDEGWIIDPIPRKIPRPPGGSVWADVKGSNGTTLLLSGLGEIYAAGTDETGWVARYGKGRDVLRERARLGVPGNWQPIRTLSACPTHMLLQGADGRLRALGYNDSLQLGSLTSDPDFQFAPVMPGGEADFLLGHNADVPILSLGQSSSEILEPVDGGGLGAQTPELLIARTGLLNTPASANLIVNVQRADGSPVEGVDTLVLLKELLVFSPAVFLPPGVSEGRYAMIPRFAPEADEDYQIKIELAPSPTYDVSDSSRVEFVYRHSKALNLPPSATQVWPPSSGEFYADEDIWVRFEVRDRDGYPTNIVLNLQGPGPGFRQSIQPLPTPPNTPQIVEFHLPRHLADWWDLGIPSLTVEDNNHGLKRILLRPFLLSRSAIPRVNVMIRGAKLTLSMNAREGELILEGSADLKEWAPIEHYQLPNPGILNPNLEIDPEVSPYRFFRLVDPIP